MLHFRILIYILLLLLKQICFIRYLQKIASVRPFLESLRPYMYDVSSGPAENKSLLKL